MKAVVFRHNSSPIGSFEETLKRAGCEVEIMDTWRDGVPAEFDPLQPDVLIVMGGAPGAYQARLYPFLQQEIDVLQKRLAADRPTLGVCLGAQLMAAALGAKTFKGPVHELGWYPLQVNGAGMKTPLLHLSGEFTKVIESHTDTFTLPEGAVLLASTEAYPNQAFSWGRNGLAVQCHPEADAPLSQAFMVASAPAFEEGKLDFGQWQRDIADYLPALERQADMFLSEWLGTIETPAAERRISPSPERGASPSA